MNYLAHLFLSGSDEEILIGNFIGDHVKGHDYLKFPPQVRKGIIIHRRIDSYTDTHRIVLQSKTYLAPAYRKYAGVIVDIFYDHFLIKNWHRYSPIELQEFKERIFKILEKYYPVLSDEVRFFIPAFIQNDWITTYSSEEGLIRVLQRLSMRSSLPDHSEFAREILHKYYLQFDSEFLTFFPDLIRHIVNKFELAIDLTNRSILKKKE